MINEILSGTQKYIAENNKTERKGKGQFFTPLVIAEFMAKKAAVPSGHLSILEPGAGNGLLTASLIKYLIERNMCQSFSIEFVENDPGILPVLSHTGELIREYIKEAGGSAEIKICTENYITDEKKREYDIVICNPPYRKIRKDSEESICMSPYVYGQPNLYGLFMCKALDDLKENGRFVFITPRSWTSGNYFKKVRHHILRNINLTDLLLFENRKNVFTDEDVLQETLITCGIKGLKQDKMICFYDENFEPFQVPAKTVKGISSDEYLLLPSRKTDIETIIKMSGLKDTFESMGYCFKTGPVVEFRNRSSLSRTEKKGYVPMFRTANIVGGNFVFPAHVDKAQYVDAGEKKLLLSNMNTVLVRRLSAKEEDRRLQSCVYRRRQAGYISIENHVNYLVRTDGTPLTEGEAEWINALLMSDDYDNYYRMINGNTQVNASEINKLPVKKENK